MTLRRTFLQSLVVSSALIFAPLASAQQPQTAPAAPTAPKTQTTVPPPKATAPVAQPATPATQTTAPAKATAPAAQATLVNLNTASAEELITLPQIGEARSKAIIEARAKGKFKNWDDFVARNVVPKNAEDSIKDKVRF